MRLVEVMRDAILPYAGEMPKVFVLQVVSILNRGSIHSATSASLVGERALQGDHVFKCLDRVIANCGEG